MGGKTVGAPEHLIVKGKRLDGRKLDEMRPLSVEVGVIPNADGSCRLQIGKTEVIVAVYGPREMFPRWAIEENRAHLSCTYIMAPFSTPERSRPGPSRRSREISELMISALAPAIVLEKYPRTKIDVFAMVSNANAGTRCAAISAAAVALADAGIDMRDMVAAVASGKADNEIVLDLFNPEDNFGQGDVPMAVMPNLKQITLLQLDGDIKKEEFKQCIAFNLKGCEQIYKAQVAALKKKYEVKNGEQND